MTAVAVISGVPLAIHRRHRDYGRDVDKLLDGWRATFIPSQTNRPSLQRIWPRVLSLIRSTNERGAHIIAYHSKISTRHKYEDESYAKHRLIWLPNDSLRLYGTECWLNLLREVLQFETNWRETIRPRDHRSSLMLPEVTFDPQRAYRDIWVRSQRVTREHDNLYGKKRSRVFDAYVNVGSLWPRRLIELAKLYRRASFIITVGDENELTLLGRDSSREGSDQRRLSSGADDAAASSRSLNDELRQISRNVLVLPAQGLDKWESLCEFLGCDYPSAPYPKCEDQAQRKLSENDSHSSRNNLPATKRLKSDSSPWIAPRKNWDGVPLAEVTVGSLRRGERTSVSERFQDVDRALWMLRDDTFPSNLALFSPRNFSIGRDHVARLTLHQERTPVREYTSASICSRQRYLYGRFVAVLKPAKVPGLVTGVFLHRNSPRQEIDIEFLGKDATKLLANVYYNPGDEGTRLEYGYRGAPTLIDLGFDASRGFHQYEIEWCATSIRWRVDGRLAHERVNWEPTPVPHLPMQFNVNLWHTRSEELAGRLAGGDLPAHTEVRAIEIHAQSVPVP